MPQRVLREETMYAALPPVEVVDMRAELRADNSSIFSRSLQRGIRGRPRRRGADHPLSQPPRQRHLCHLPRLRTCAQMPAL